MMNNIYKNKSLDHELNSNEIKVEEEQTNAFYHLFHKAKKIKDDFLFVVGIKMRTSTTEEFDLSNVQSFIESATKQGFEVEVLG